MYWPDGCLVTGRRRDLGRKEVAAKEMEKRRKSMEKEKEVEAAIDGDGLRCLLVWKWRWRLLSLYRQSVEDEFDRSTEILLSIYL